MQQTAFAGNASAQLLVLCRSEEHTSELQSLRHLVCRLLLEKKNNGRSPISVRETVPAICVRAASSTGASPETVMLVSVAPTFSANGISNAASIVTVKQRVRVVNPGLSTFPSYGPIFRYGNRNRPSCPVTAVLLTLVSVSRALTFFSSIPPPPRSTLFPYTTLFR